ncbi:MAG: hypothetical protein COA58_12630 [Bacteroidetes bacterium]|nr:MAG: hypothetical protein COA58_12630 [Bacteroidota bacterium]
MKNITLLLLSFLIISPSIFAQIGKVNEISAKMSEGTNRGFKVLIPETNKKEVLKAWSRLMKDYEAKTEKVKKYDDYRSMNASIPSVSDRPIVVYAIFQETPEGVYLKSFFDLGGAYLNRDLHKEQAAAAQKLLKTFATSVAKATIESKVKQETKKLEKLEKEQKGLVKSKEGYEKDIKNAKETIEKREKSITENATKQAGKMKEIGEQKKVTEQIKAKLKKF